MIDGTRFGAGKIYLTFNSDCPEEEAAFERTLTKAQYTDPVISGLGEDKVSINSKVSKGLVPGYWNGDFKGYSVNLTGTSAREDWNVLKALSQIVKESPLARFIEVLYSPDMANTIDDIDTKNT